MCVSACHAACRPTVCLPAYQLSYLLFHPISLLHTFVHANPLFHSSAIPIASLYEDPPIRCLLTRPPTWHPNRYHANPPSTPLPTTSACPPYLFMEVLPEGGFCPGGEGISPGRGVDHPLGNFVNFKWCDMHHRYFFYFDPSRSLASSSIYLFTEATAYSSFYPPTIQLIRIRQKSSGPAPNTASENCWEMTDIINASTGACCLRGMITLNLGLAKHASIVGGKCFFQLHQLRWVHHALDADLAAPTIHAFITSCIDYCNCLFSAAPVLSDKLRRFCHVAAHVFDWNEQIWSGTHSNPSQRLALAGCFRKDRV